MNRQEFAGRRRSRFLVRGANSDELRAALESEVDVICIDLEDTVPQADKDAARKLAQSLPSLGVGREFAVRINAVSTENGLRDLLMLSGWEQRPPVVLMTKVNSPFEVQLAAGLLPGTKLHIIIETAAALEAATAIAQASPAVGALLLGGKDLSAALGCARSWEGLLYARGRLVRSAALAGVEAHDEPYRPLEDLEGLKIACAKARAMGFAGKATVDLRHVKIINDVFA